MIDFNEELLIDSATDIRHNKHKNTQTNKQTQHPYK